MAPVNLSEPGWTLRQGQVLWRSAREAPEVAGDFLLAMHPDGRSLVQFIKTPLPLVTAQMAPMHWQIEFIPQKRMMSGRGLPPAQFIWLHLSSSLNGTSPPNPLRFERMPDGGWRLDNTSTGEALTGYDGP